MNLKVTVGQMLDAVALQQVSCQTYVCLNKIKVRRNEVKTTLLMNDGIFRLWRSDDKIRERHALAGMLYVVEPRLSSFVSKIRVPFLRRIERECETDLRIEVD